MSDAARHHKLGFWMCLALVMGNMIGSGVFLLPASLAPYGWNAVAAWGVTIAGAVALGLVIARLTRALPEANGAIGIVEHVWGPVPGFVIGWAYWVSIWTAVVTIAVAAISYASVFVPILGRWPGVSALALMWLLILVNLRGARAAGGFQLATTVLKLMPLIAVIVIIGIILARDGTARLAPWPTEGLALGQINIAATLTLWALLGFESATICANKIERPEVIIPRATVVGVVATGIIYLIVCSGIELMLPAAEAAASPAPFGLFVEREWGSGAGLAISAFAAISAIGALNGWILLQGELPLDMARRAMLPPWLAGTDDTGTPARALTVSGILASILVLLQSGSGTADLFKFMLLISTSANLWFYLAASLTALRLGLVMPVAAFGAIYSIWTLWGAGVVASAWCVGLMALGLPVYLWVRRSRAATQPAE